MSQLQLSDKNICGLVSLSNRQTEALQRLYLRKVTRLERLIFFFLIYQFKIITHSSISERCLTASNQRHDSSWTSQTNAKHSPQ